MLGIIIIAQLFTVLALPIKQDLEEQNYVLTLKEIRMKSNGFPDVSSGEKLERWTPDSKVNPEELGSYFEGDILHLPLQNRNGLISTQFRWPDGVVPYKVNGNFSFQERVTIFQAIYMFHENTCIKFRPYQNGDRNYVSIENAGAGCFSSVGRVGGEQVVNLQARCLTTVGTPIHELMHTLGFIHEHSRLERDDYIDILWNNIVQGKEYNFEKHTSTGFGIEYDYGSVMHYSATSSSKNGQPTIRPKIHYIELGQRKRLSSSDIMKINIMYKC